MLDDRWDELSDEAWNEFARAWLCEIREQSADEIHDERDDDVSLAVVQMNFTASAKSQWRFIKLVYGLAQEDAAGDEALGHLAAGPVEHFLGKHGDEYIDVVESIAKHEPRFAFMLRSCYRHLMSDDVWRRVCIARKNGETESSDS